MKQFGLDLSKQFGFGGQKWEKYPFAWLMDKFAKLDDCQPLTWFSLPTVRGWLNIIFSGLYRSGNEHMLKFFAMNEGEHFSQKKIQSARLWNGSS